MSPSPLPHPDYKSLAFVGWVAMPCRGRLLYCLALSLLYHNHLSEKYFSVPLKCVYFDHNKFLLGLAKPNWTGSLRRNNWICPHKGSRSSVCSQGSKGKKEESEIRNPKSLLQFSQSAVKGPKERKRNLKSKIRNLFYSLASIPDAVKAKGV